MSHQMKTIREDQLSSIKKQIPASIFIGEIDGETIRTRDDYLNAVWQVFSFPYKEYMGLDAYLDWIRDLSWLHAEGYVFIIRRAAAMLRESPRDREIILRSLENTVLPWWESDVEKCVVEGKAKPFDIYLVE